MNDQTDQAPTPRPSRAPWRIIAISLVLVALLVLTGWVSHENGVIATQHAMLAMATAEARTTQTAQAQATATAAAHATATARTEATATAVAKRVFATATAQARATATAVERRVQATATAYTAMENAAATAQALADDATATAQADQYAVDVANATATAQADTMTGVHLCSVDHFDPPSNACTQDDNTLTDLSGARVVVYGPYGNNFTEGSLTFVISQRHDDGSYTQVGSYTDDAIELSTNSYSFHFDGVLSEAGVTPEAGETYEVSVQEPDVNLGDALFTYEGE